MAKLISVTCTLLLTAVVIEMMVGTEGDIFEASDTVFRVGVLVEETETSEEVQLACSSKCVEVGEDCFRFEYRATHKLCTVTKLKREESGNHSAPLARFFHRKSGAAVEKKQVSAVLTYSCTHSHAHM